MLESAAVSAEQTGDQTAPQRAMDGFLTDFARQNPDLAWFAQLVAMQQHECLGTVGFEFAMRCDVDNAVPMAVQIVLKLIVSELLIQKHARGI